MPVEFAVPREVHDLKRCWFYHVMDLPGYGITGGEWDLRATYDDYVAHFDFKGKTVLDCGCASGFGTFQMEARGASVVSVDMADGYDFDIIPFYSTREKYEKRRQDIRFGMETCKDSYWLAHRVLKSKARAYYGTVYDIPKELGDFDVVVMGQILVHLRDPFKALASASAPSKDTVIITEAIHNSELPLALFHPRASIPTMDHSWWKMSVPLYREMLGILGFEIKSLTYSKHLCTANGQMEELATINARRP